MSITKPQLSTFRSNRGFTLVELTLAMAIFSFVLIIMIAGIVRLIHFYQATIDVRATQQAAREVSDDLSAAARASSYITIDSSGPAHVTGGPYGSQLESEVCFFTNVAHLPSNQIVGSGTVFYSQKSGANQWTIYQATFSGLTSSLGGSGSCNPGIVNPTAITSQSVSFIRFAATESNDNRLVNFNMVIAGSGELVPNINISYPGYPGTPVCYSIYGADANNYCSITNLQMAAAARGAQS